MQEKNLSDTTRKIENLIDKGNFTKALSILNRGNLRGCRGVQWGDGSKYHFLLAECYRGLGFFATAIKHYMTCLKKTPAIFSPKPLLYLAACHRAIGNRQKSLFFAKKAFTQSRKFNMMTSDARLELALAYRLKGDFKKAEKELKTLLKIYSKEKDYSAISFVLWALAGIYRLEGKYRKSITAFKTSIKNAIKTKDKIASGYSMFGLAGVLRVAGFIVQSEHYYRKARNIFSKTQDLFAKAYSECGLANALRQKGKLRESLECYKKARRLYSLIQDRADLGFVEWGIGEILKKQGKFRQALKHFNKALNLFKNKSEPRGEILAEISLSQTLYLLGNHEKSDKIYFKAIKKAKKHHLHTYLETFT